MRHYSKIIKYYNKAFLKGAKNSDTLWTAGMKSSKKIIKNKKLVNKIKKLAIKFIGSLAWPNMFPTSLDPVSGDLLYNLVRLTKPRLALEIGTFKGFATICIAGALEDNNQGGLYSMDPEEQSIVYRAIKKSKLKHRIKYIIDYSYNIIPKLDLKNLDFVLIDGDHSYENCKQDFDLVKDKISKNGLIVFHDSLVDKSFADFDGPKRVVETIKNSGHFEVITLPTQVGIDRFGKVVLNNKDVENFKPVGLSICKKI